MFKICIAKYFIPFTSKKNLEKYFLTEKFLLITHGEKRIRNHLKYLKNFDKYLKYPHSFVIIYLTPKLFPVIIILKSKKLYI